LPVINYCQNYIQKKYKCCCAVYWAHLKLSLAGEDTSQGEELWSVSQTSTPKSATILNAPSLFAIPQVAAGNHRKVQNQAKCITKHAEK
jgi:hypothetical protein